MNRNPSNNPPLDRELLKINSLLALDTYCMKHATSREKVLAKMSEIPALVFVVGHIRLEISDEKHQNPLAPKRDKTPFYQYTTDIDYQQVSIHKLVVSQGYQRKDLNQANINKIANDFDPHKLDALKVWVSEEGKYVVHDGQHRLYALLAVFKDEDFHVWCEIHQNMTYEQAAIAFALQDIGRTRLSKMQEFNGLSEGKDAATVALEAELGKYGIHVAKSKTEGATNTIYCTDKLMSVHGGLFKYNLKDTGAVIRVLKTAYPGNPQAFHKVLVGGVAVFHKTYKGEYDDPRLIKVLSQTDPSAIRAIGQADIVVKGDARFAKAILMRYNKNRNKENQLPNRFDV